MRIGAAETKILYINPDRVPREHGFPGDSRGTGWHKLTKFQTLAAELSDSKPAGLACVGLLTLGVGTSAGAGASALLALSLGAMALYSVIFRRNA
jgi:hypothetical protein